MRGAIGVGTPEVEVGARGVVRLFGIAPVPARVTAKRAGRSWSWRVGPVELHHRVERRNEGCAVAIDMVAPAPLETALRVGYGPLVELLVRNLARVAARAEGGEGSDRGVSSRAGSAWPEGKGGEERSTSS